MAKIIDVSWSNVNCEKDITNTLVWIRRILRVLGIWPLVYSDTSTIEKVLATFSFAFCWSVLSFLLIPMTVFVFSNQSVLRDKIKMLGPLGYVLISLLKYFFMVIHYKNIRQCIRMLSVDWHAIQQENHRKIMIKDAARGHVLSKLCIAFMYCGGLCFHTVMPFLAQKPDNELNITVRAIPYPGFDIIFDVNLTPIYVFVFCGQWFGGIAMFNVTTATCCLAIMFVSHACGQIDVIISRMENLMKRDTQNNYINSEQRMAIIVKQHVQTLKFSAKIETILNEICLVELVGSTLIICLLEYYCLTEWQNSDSIAILTYFFLLISFAFNIFIFCYISELLTEQCIKVGHISYKIEWYNLPGKTALDLMMMITMARRPIQITAGRLISLSFTNFGNVLKTSVAYLNLLRNAI